MSAKIINGKQVRDEMLAELSNEVIELTEQGMQPGLAVVVVGEDPASKLYVGMKVKKCGEVGIHSELYELSAEATEQELLDLIAELNAKESIHGILVQLPLPGHMREEAVIEAISLEKDVDGFHPMSTGNLQIGEDCFVPCTPAGIMELIRRTGMDLAGKHAVVVGRSNIVGKPVAMLLLQADATVTICHSKTANLPEITKQADVLVAAAGRPGLLGKEHIKPGAVVIDVGSPKGDVRFEEAEEVAGYITPVPGGVGPMTITMLLKNTIDSARKALKIRA
ncbi:bifunctional 5,10-methylenetetrahydrofolate dehydrogenase/5,10-methenyltetrahydrofolate cyclohydrolase [Marinicrinis sediminis]|uniref:Bifunctional protein FolD n=1 Tax=Marinicrinis sediminis TaxID=1652465 RepID=A0ABW5RCT4_9BACL